MDSHDARTLEIDVDKQKIFSRAIPLALSQEGCVPKGSYHGKRSMDAAFHCTCIFRSEEQMCACFI